MTGTSTISPAEPVLKSHSSLAPKRSSASRKILVVDDSPTNREFLVTTLGYAGHQLIEAASGEEARRGQGPNIRI